MKKEICEKDIKGPKKERSLRVEKALTEIKEAEKSFNALMKIKDKLESTYKDIINKT